MEILGSCYIDGVPVEVCTFLIDNVSDVSSSEERFQSYMVEQWRVVFGKQESKARDEPAMLYASRDCRAQTSTVGARWRQCVFVLLPKEPLTRGELASHKQRLLAVTVGAKERLSMQQLVHRMRATYGTTTAGLEERLRPYGGGAVGRDRGISEGSFFFVLEEDSVEMGEEEGKVCKTEKGNTKSALIVSRDSLTSHEQKSLPARATIRHNPDAIGVSPPPLTAKLPHPAVLVGSVVPNEPRLGELSQMTPGSKEVPPRMERAGSLPVSTLASAVRGVAESKLGPGKPKEQMPSKDDTLKEAPVGGAQLMSHVQECSQSLLRPVTKSTASTAMSSAMGEAVTESRTSDSKPSPQPHPRTRIPKQLSFRSREEKDSLHAIEHKYNGLDAPCVRKVLMEGCTKEQAEQVVRERRQLVDHEMFQCYSPTCSACKTIRSLGEKHSQYCELCGCAVPHCETMKKQCSTASRHTVTNTTGSVPKESTDGLSSYQPKTVAQLAPPNVPSTAEELPLPTQDVTTAQRTDTPTATSTTPPISPIADTASASPMPAPTATPTATPPAKHPSGKVSLKESIQLVATHQSLKNQPKEYLPPGGMIDKKILKKYFFGYNVMPDVFANCKMEDSHNQHRKGTLGRGGNGDVYKAGYNGRVFAVKETKYRPDEIQKWKKMCHPNLVPLLALQYRFCPFEPVEKGAVVAHCWAFMPVMDIDLRSVLTDLDPLVDRMNAASPREAAEMMSNAKHILREILKGLEALHNIGLVHRDIKEHNILLRSQCQCPDCFTCVCPRESKCEVAIADFDSLMENGAKNSSRRVPGTYGYRAPETYTSSKVSFSFDVWGFGVIATKVFLGRDQEEQKKDAATLLHIDARQQHQTAEVFIPQLKLMELLSYRGGDLYKAAMFVKECLEVDASRRKTASVLLNSPSGFLSS